MTDPTPTDLPTSDSTATESADSKTTETPYTEPRMSQLRETLDADAWRAVNCELLAKTVAEFLFEDLIDAERVGGAEDGDTFERVGATESIDTAESADAADDTRRYRVRLDDVAYRFDASERRFDSYHVDPTSLERRAGGEWTPATDAILFLRDVRETLGLPERTLSHLIREHQRTLLADAHLEAEQSTLDDPLDPTALGYVDLDARLDGHPWITYNKGRIGFSYDDYRRFAPESRNAVTLRWAAAHRDAATVATADGGDYDAFVRRQLSDDALDTFESVLVDRGLDPEDYHLLPVHEWQWDNTVASFYADEIACDRLVPLGTGETRYRPLQSIRTLANADDPEASHVKLPIRIRNTLVYRGIPSEKIQAAPAVSDALRGVLADDPFLSEECDLILLGEVASVDYSHPVYGDIDGAPYQHRELLGAIWRESPRSFLDAGEVAIPLAALFHEEGSDAAVISSLVAESGLDVEVWCDRLFKALLPPLLHFLYRYGIGFSPHGEDAILVLEDGVPTRVGLKDFIDVSLAETDLPEHDALPDRLWDVLGTKAPDRLRHCIVSSLFICVLRYVADVLVRHHGYDEDRFWRQVRERILAYQRRFPDLAERFATFDLLDESFAKLCLNRNRFAPDGYADEAGRPSIAEHGTLPNALHEVTRDDG